MQELVQLLSEPHTLRRVEETVGIYMLVLVYSRLARVHSAPGYVEPPEPRLAKKGTGQRDICAKCGTTLERALNGGVAYLIEAS